MPNDLVDTYGPYAAGSTLDISLDSVTGDPIPDKSTGGAKHVTQVPATQGASITPSDSTTVDFSSLYVGGAGDVALMLYDDVAAITITAPPVGTLITGLRIKRVMATNTTATLLVGFN